MYSVTSVCSVIKCSWLLTFESLVLEMPFFVTQVSLAEYLGQVHVLRSSFVTGTKR